MKPAQCIYSYQPLNTNVPSDDFSASKEHIIPWALGGSDQFTTSDVAKRFNNDFGRDIDAPFINLMPFAVKRHQLGIEGYSGKVPPIEWSARSLDNNEPIAISIEREGKVSYRHQTAFVRDAKQTHAEVLIGGDREKVNEILAGLLRKASGTNQKIYSITGEQILSVADASAHYDVEETTLMKATIEAFNLEVWMRGICKIVLGVGHFFLGPNWTFSVDGNRFRAVVAQPRSEWPVDSLKGYAAGQIPKEVAHCLGITPAVRAAQLHTLAVVPGQPAMAVISFFGGDGVPEAMISTGVERGNLAVVNDQMQSGTRIGVRIDPRSRKATWITVGDLQRAAEGTQFGGLGS